jgi:hypothetical protein
MRAALLEISHVVRRFKANRITVEWKGQPYKIRSVERPTNTQLELDDDGQEVVTGPDLALLIIQLDHHPCVFLDTAVALHDSLYSYGYPQDYPNGDPVAMTFEDFSRNPLLLKFKGGQVRPGSSGSPILNLRTGAVCGLITKTRDETTDLNRATRHWYTRIAAMPS